MHNEQHHDDYIDIVCQKGPVQLSKNVKMALIAMIIVGFGTFAFQAFVNESSRIGWISFLHNLYFFTGLSAAGVVIAAIIQTTNANWGRPLKRFTEASGAFLPLALIGVVVLYFGADQIYVWIDEPPHTPIKHFWLTKNFVFGRVFAAITILWLAARWLTRNSDRPDIGLAHEKNGEAWQLPPNWKGLDEEVAHCQKQQSKAGPIYCVLFAFMCSILAYDLIMSLDYKWFSTMFGGWHFTTNMLMAFGFLYFLVHFMSRKFGLEAFMPQPMFHDMGKLTFGFTVMWGYLFFAQYLVIWYGNLAHETGYLLTRFEGENWWLLSRIVLAMVFVIPFILGLSKKRKLTFGRFAPVVVISMIGIWLERFVLIAPSTWYFDRAAGTYQDGIGLLLVSDALVFLGFLGVFLLAYTSYLYKRPAMVVTDPKLPLGIHRH